MGLHFKFLNEPEQHGWRKLQCPAVSEANCVTPKRMRQCGVRAVRREKDNIQTCS